MAVCVCRETMLQALRFVIQGAGAKVDPTIRKNITSTLLGMLGHDEVCEHGADASQRQSEPETFKLWLQLLVAVRKRPIRRANA